ncbi:MAG: phosphoribosylglycinamide formyltransferase [Mariprofundales bacterium]
MPITNITKLPIAIMASGKGSNFAAIVNAAKLGLCPVDIRLLISDRINSPALQLARDFGIKTYYISPKDYKNRTEFDAACAQYINDAACKWIVLAGYMRILSDNFVEQFANHIINIHPSLLPSFTGAHAVRDALQYGVKITGCTVHIVNEILDSGPILGQEAIEILDNDTEQNLHTRIHAAEHRLYPRILHELAISEHLRQKDLTVNI